MKREEVRFEKIFSNNHVEEKEMFFLRTANLGNVPVMERIIKEKGFQPKPSLLEKAFSIANKNKHDALYDYLLTVNPAVETKPQANTLFAREDKEERTEFREKACPACGY